MENGRLIMPLHIRQLGENQQKLKIKLELNKSQQKDGQIYFLPRIERKKLKTLIPFEDRKENLINKLKKTIQFRSYQKVNLVTEPTISIKEDYKEKRIHSVAFNKLGVKRTSSVEPLNKFKIRGSYYCKQEERLRMLLENKRSG